MDELKYPAGCDKTSIFGIGIELLRSPFKAAIIRSGICTTRPSTSGRIYSWAFHDRALGVDLDPSTPSRLCVFGRRRGGVAILPGMQYQCLFFSVWDSGQPAICSHDEMANFTYKGILPLRMLSFGACCSTLSQTGLHGHNALHHVHKCFCSTFCAIR